MDFFSTNLRAGFLKSLSFLVIMTFAGGFVFVQAQTVSDATGRGNSDKPEPVKSAEMRVEQITEKSWEHFRNGLNHLGDLQNMQARMEFDSSVIVFLKSGINLQRNPQLRECYNQLIETVYRLEFPSSRRPVNSNEPANFFDSLWDACGWEIKVPDDLARNVLSDLKQKSKNLIPYNGETVANGSNITEPPIRESGFAKQKFEPSPLDELAKLELNEDEINVGTLKARQEYETTRVVVEKNRSFGFSFQMHPLVQQFINYYRGRGRKTMEVGLYRSGLFMSMARRIFREEGVPENMAWLGQVESAWKPTARSWAAAAGLWQFIPGTASRYQLRRTAYLDERQSFEKATRASARYLKFLANRYKGSWELAMAGYNCGEGNVDRAIRKAGVSNIWAAYRYLPSETRKYVPNILATIIIANNPDKYGFGHVRPARPLKYDRVRVPASVKLRLVAQASGTNVKYLRYLNPELRSNRTPPEPYVIRVPRGKAQNVIAVLGKLPRFKRGMARLSNSTKGETWKSISLRTGVSVAELRRANPKMKAPTGRVIVPARGNRVNNTSYVRRRPLTVKAIAGDTVEKLAKRHKVSPDKVAKLNKLLKTSKLKAGREIKIPVK